MKITLPKEVLAKLPAPDSTGMVRVKASLKINEDGTAELSEINDTPVPTGDADGDKNEDAPTADDANPMPVEPSMADAPTSLY